MVLSLTLIPLLAKVLANLEGLVKEPTDEAKIFTKVSITTSPRKLLRSTISAKYTLLNKSLKYFAFSSSFLRAKICGKPP